MQMRRIVRTREGRGWSHARERGEHLGAEVARDCRDRRQWLVLLDAGRYLMRCRVAHVPTTIIRRLHTSARVIGLRAAGHRRAAVPQFGQSRRPRSHG